MPVTGVKSSAYQGYVFVLLSGTLFGTMGIFLKLIMRYSNFTSPQIAAARATIVTIALLLGIGLFRRSLLKVRFRDLPFLVLFGLLGMAAIHTFFIYAVQLTTVAIAVMLTYTSPMFASLISWRFAGERMTWRKAVSLSITFAGCFLVVRGYDLAQLRLNWLGILAGICSGFFLALYSLLGHRATARHGPWTALVYGMGFGAVFLWVAEVPFGVASFGDYPLATFLLVVLALVPTLFAYLAYNFGLRYLSASDACLVATVEPVVGTLLAFLLLGEILQAPQLAGGALVIAGIVILQQSSLRSDSASGY